MPNETHSQIPATSLQAATTLLQAGLPGLSPERLKEIINEAAVAERQPPAKVPPERRFLSVHEAEAYAGLSRWTLGRLARSGRLPVAKLTPGRSGKVLIDVRDLDSFLGKCKRRRRAVPATCENHRSAPSPVQEQ